MEYPDTFGAIVRRRREALRLSRGALADLVACSEETIKKIERDERRPSPEVAALLAKHLLISAAEREEFQLMARGLRNSRSVGSSYPPLPFMRQPLSTRSNVFVARERELAYLHTQLDHALAHEGRVVFVTGSAGSGKSSLVRAFVERSCALHPNLIAVSGSCTAYVGIGDPYLPFREQLDLLTGEIASIYETGGIDGDIAQRLWELLPQACDALLDQGTDLIGTFRSSHGLAARVAQALAAGAPIGAQSARLQSLLVQRSAPTPLHQLDLFTQYTRVLQRLAEHSPLIVIVEDLQWADEGSLSLLFHLGRRLAGRRILVVGIYRPLEPGSTAQTPHPLQSVVNELQRIHGTRAIDLGQIDRQAFIDALLDTEPNLLGPDFRDALYRQTGGHALFTVEMLRDMQERGALLRDADGAWIAGSSLGWETLPARIEGVIRERFDRVSPSLRALLTAASVEGESFTAEVIAAALRLEPGDVNHTLSAMLADQHHLVEFEAARDVDGRRLHRYRFHHNLFQTYLYGIAGPTERARLHQVIGSALEQLYLKSLEWVAPQLARHYLAGGSPSHAVRALAIAADGARRLFALGEALRSYDQALALTEAHPETVGVDDLRGLREQRGRTRVEAGEFAGAVADLEAVLASYPAGDPRRRGPLAALGMTHRRRDDYDAARERLAEALELARAADDAPAVANILYHLGTVEWSDGDNAAATPLHEEAVTICRREGLEGVVAIQALHGGGEALFAQGRPDRAVEMFAESLKLARDTGDRSYEAENLMMLGFSQSGFMGVGQYHKALASFDEALAISQATHLDWHSGYILAGRGETKGRAGDYQGGVADLTAALALKLSVDTARYQVIALDHFGDLLADLGERERALEVREQALRLAQDIGVGFWLPRQQANLGLARLALGDMSCAALLENALALAHRRKQGFHAVRCLEALTALESAREDYTATLDYADQLLGLARAGGLAEYAAIAHFWRGCALLGAGQLDSAQTDLQRAADAAEEVCRPTLLSDAHLALAELCAIGGRGAEAEAHRAAAEAASLRIRRPPAEALAISL